MVTLTLQGLILVTYLRSHLSIASYFQVKYYFMSLGEDLLFRELGEHRKI